MGFVNKDKKETYFERNPTITNLVKKYAHKNNITLAQAKDIWMSMFAFLKHVAESGDRNNPDTFQSVFIKHIGTFFPSKKAIETITKKANESSK